MLAAVVPLSIKVRTMPIDRKNALSDIGKLLRSELARESQPHHPDIEQALRRLIERDIADRSRFHKAESWQSKKEKASPLR